MNPLTIIEKYYAPDSEAYRILIVHSELVMHKAQALAENVAHLQPNMPFIREAAMLHDIGIFKTHAPEIGCFGEHPYICHGYLGRELLEKEGYPRHALVCERHTGVGITRADIARQKWPIPHRDMAPVSLEEKIICFADKFFSKKPNKLLKEKSIDKVRKKIAKYGEDKSAIVEEWIAFFGVDREN
ncbi:MAG: HD domain-containing protein [bacterium]